MIGDRLYLGDSMRRVAVMRGGECIELNPRFDLVRHSPDGFYWGYGGSGPAQLALALCCDVLGDDRAALSIYQLFKRRWVANLKMAQAWGADESELRSVMHELLGKVRS